MISRGRLSSRPTTVTNTKHIEKSFIIDILDLLSSNVVLLWLFVSCDLKMIASSLHWRGHLSVLLILEAFAYWPEHEPLFGRNVKSSMLIASSIVWSCCKWQSEFMSYSFLFLSAGSSTVSDLALTSPFSHSVIEDALGEGYLHVLDHVIQSPGSQVWCSLSQRQLFKFKLLQVIIDIIHPFFRSKIKKQLAIFVPVRIYWDVCRLSPTYCRSGRMISGQCFKYMNYRASPREPSCHVMCVFPLCTMTVVSLSISQVLPLFDLCKFLLKYSATAFATDWRGSISVLSPETSLYLESRERRILCDKWFIFNKIPHTALWWQKK